MTTASEVKNLFNQYVSIETEHDEIDSAWELNVENAEIEAAWDECYKRLWNKGMEFGAALADLTNGQIDQMLGHRMLTSKRDELVSLFAKVA